MKFNFNLRKSGKLRRIKIGIRPQLIILVCFASLFSLLILGIVIGVYVSDNVSHLRADRLHVIAQLKATQIKQAVQFIYFQCSLLAEEESISKSVSYYRVGDTSSSIFQQTQLLMETFLKTSDTFASARLYNLNLDVVALALTVNLTEDAQETLYPLDLMLLAPAALFETNSTNAITTGFISGPWSENLNSLTYYVALTLPVNANQSIILTEKVVSGYLTVVANAQAIQTALDNSTYTDDYVSVAIKPVYNGTDHTDLAGFELLFRGPSLLVLTNTVLPLSRSEAATRALTKGEGTATQVSSLLGVDVAIGFSIVHMDSDTYWSVIVEQVQSKFSQPVKKLADIIIAVVIGIGVFVCLITFPLAVWFVNPITKLKNAAESITGSKKQKEQGSRKEDGSDAAGSLEKRNLVSSGNSTVYSTGIRLPDRIPQSKKFFKDEITELSDAFNIMTEELEKQYNHLEDRVRLRTKELEASKIEAEAANEAKTVFIANISHELRTPLNGILGMTSIAMDETDHTQIQDSLKLIHRSGELLLHILTELLTFSKNTLNRSKLETSNFQILDVVYQVKSIFSKLALDQRVNFRIILKPAILRKLVLLGDSNRIIQVVMNLVSNSLKFTPVDGFVDVNIRLLGEYDLEASREQNFAKVCIKSHTPDDYVDAVDEDLEFAPVSLVPKLEKERKSSIPDIHNIRRTNTAASLRSLRNGLDNIDTHSIMTISTSEYEEQIFQSQFAEPSKFPVEQFYEDESEASSDATPALSDSDLNDENNRNQVLQDSETRAGSSSSETGDLKPIKPSLIQNDTKSLPDLAEFANAEIVRNNKTYKLRRLNAPKTWVIQVEVRDTGSGIEPALHEKVFEPFIQGDQTLSRSYGGTGLGLSICRQLAKMMNGTLTLKSAIGKGSKFTFTLPLTQVGEVIVPPSQLAEFCEDEFNPNAKMNRKVLFNIEESNSLSDGPDNRMDDTSSRRKQSYTESMEKQMRSLSTTCTVNQSTTGTVSNLGGETCLDNMSYLRILVAEDNSVNQEVIKRMLKLEGFRNITMAGNGAEAVDLVKTSYEKMAAFDVIFMDVQMPKMDGLTATKIIRKNLKYKKPIVALTAFTDESNVKECLSSGMSGFLSKPIKRSNLRKILTEISPELLSEIVTTPNTHLEEESSRGFFFPITPDTDLSPTA